MKTFTGLFTTLSLGALLLTGCVNEEPPYKNAGDGTADSATTGFLSGAMSLRVIYDTETDTQPDDTQDETQTPPSAQASTRAVTDTDGYRVRIVSTDDQSSHFDGTYAELQTELAAGPKELPIGNYELSVCSHRTEEIQSAAWNTPVYGTTYAFSITKGATTQIEEIVCTLQNIKVTLLCSADLADQLTAGTKATVSLGSASLEFSKEHWDGEQAAFFMPAAKSNDLKFVLSGSFTDGGDVTFSKTISGVKAGQWRKIELVIVYADQGGIKFDISVDNFVLDDTITVNGTEGLWEEVFEEGGGEEPGETPTIVMQGWDITQPYVLETLDPVRVDIAAPNGGIQSLLVRIESVTLEAILSEMPALAGEFDLCEIDAESEEGNLLQTAVGFPVGDEVKGHQSTYFEIPSKIIGALKELSQPGESHQFHLKVIDNAGGEASATLTLVVPTEE